MRIVGFCSVKKIDDSECEKVLGKLEKDRVSVRVVGSNPQIKYYFAECVELD
jgi:hypothetical protein